MVRKLSPEQHRATLDWATALKPDSLSRRVYPPLTPQLLIDTYRDPLIQYFRLCALARSSTASLALTSEADALLFRTRVILENHLQRCIASSGTALETKMRSLRLDSFYGVSKKQGVSVRFPLRTCHPTVLCAGACYAHDVLDATPAAVVRGVINGFAADAYESGNTGVRTLILSMLRCATRRAARAAIREIKELPAGFTRRPYIRFSHVGELAAYPAFANALASLVHKESGGEVDCVIYTRHRNASALDHMLWIINFTLDPSSQDRRTWVPRGARVVYSAFAGAISADAAVNFLEHHRHTHLPVTSGTGNVCPATLPDCSIRTCDACKCATCFEKPTSRLDAPSLPKEASR